METLRIRGQDVAVDIRTELEQFNWTRPKWSADKLIAASPFRYDKTPSFFVNFTGEYAGCFGDSGAYDKEWESGNFTKLMSFLRNETYEETEEYLLGEYGVPSDGTGAITLRPVSLRIQRFRQLLSADVLAQYTEDYAYLKNRGISERVQRQMGVLYDSQGKAAVLPWRTADGRMANVKYRKTYGKTFWYQKGGRPIRELVYGIERAEQTTVICEAEIDAMSWMEAGYSAVAVGGASFNSWKRDVILRSPIEELIIATDNDKAGGKLRREIEAMMRGHVRLRHAYVGAEFKDANEALMKYGAEVLRESVERSESTASLYVNLRTFGRGR
jgi:DNA primase